LPGAATGPYSLAFDLNLSEDGVEVLQLDIESSLLRLDADGWLSDAPGYIGSELQIDAELKSLADISAAYGIGSFSDRALTITGFATLSEDGIQTRGPVSIQSGDIVATVDGLLALTPGIVGSDITFKLSGSSLAALVKELVATDYIPAEAYDLGGRIQLGQNDYRLRDIAGTVGRSSVEVDGLLKLAGGLAGTRIRFKSEGPAIEELTASIEELNIRPGPYALAATLSLANDAIKFDDIEFTRGRGQIMGDLELAFPESGLEADFDLQASGDDLQSIVGAVSGFEVREAPFSVDARGMLRSTRVSLDRLNISVGESTANVNGDFDFAKSSRSTRFSIGINIPDLANLGTHNGRKMHGQSLTINASVNGGGGFLHIDDLRAKLGDSDIRGKLRLEKGDVPKLSAEIFSDSLLLAPLLEEQAYDPEPEFDDGRLIPDIAIPFDRMRNLNARIKIDIGRLQRGALIVTNLKKDLELHDGELTLHDFEAQPHAGWLQARGSLGPADGSGKARFAATARGVAFGLSELDTNFDGRGDIEINLESTGTNLRSLAANLDGIIFMNSTNIIIPENKFLKRLYGDMLNEIVSTINPFSKSSTIHRLDCVVLPLEITDGALITNPFALVLNASARMVIKSSINLQSEKLSLQFETTPRKGITISAGEILNPYVKVVGTLAKPTLAVDEQGVLISGGAAVATGGLSILAKAAWRRLSRDKNACQTAAEKSVEALGDRFPEFSPPVDATAN